MSSVEQMRALSALEEPKSSQGIVDLPCGYLDESDVLHTEVELKELTGEEEDLLFSKTIPNHKKMSALIGRCIKRIGTITDRGRIAMLSSQLLIGDRVFLMFALRRLSMGDQYPFRVNCPECGMVNNFTIDLGSLEIQKMEDPAKRVFSVKLKSGSEVTFRLLNGTDEEALASYRKDDRLSFALQRRIEMLNGKPPSLKDVKSMSMRDRDELRAIMDGHDGGIDTTLEMTCSYCAAEFEDDVDPSQPGFFFPSMTQKKLRSKSSTS